MTREQEERQGDGAKGGRGGKQRGKSEEVRKQEKGEEEEKR